MNDGPADKAVKSYSKLLELRPDHQPYQQALKKAKAYANAAETTKEYWYPDAPYSGYKGRYSYYVASKPKDTADLKEKFILARTLYTTGYMGFSISPFSKDPRSRDKYLKAMQLYNHIVEYYPKNEYLVLRSKADIAGIKLTLYKDIEAYVLAHIEFYLLDVKKIVDSTIASRNQVLEGGLTRAQQDFVKYFKNHSRQSVIEKSVSHAGHLKAAGIKDGNLLDEIIKRCKKADPTIVGMAKAAKAKLESQDMKSH